MEKGIDPTKDTGIKAIFDRPGQAWSNEERKIICKWLFEDRNRDYLLGFASSKIGIAEGAEHAEDALSDFFLNIRPFIYHYDPARGKHFWNYLLFCLERHCYKYSKKIRNRRKYEQLTKKGAVEQIEFVEPERSTKTTPETELMMKELVKTLNKCIQNLLPKYGKVFELKDAEELSIEEISVKLAISISNVRVRLHRARIMLKECLQREGGAW